MNNRSLHPVSVYTYTLYVISGNNCTFGLLDRTKAPPAAETWFLKVSDDTYHTAKNGMSAKKCAFWCRNFNECGFGANL